MAGGWLAEGCVSVCWVQHDARRRRLGRPDCPVGRCRSFSHRLRDNVQRGPERVLTGKSVRLSAVDGARAGMTAMENGAEE
jgi:hypothetical protein